MHPSHVIPSADSAGFFKLERDGLTQGTLAKWMLCPEKARLSVLNGLDMAGHKSAIEFGNIFHENLEKVYTIYGQHAKDSVPFSIDDAIATSESYLRRQEAVCYAALHNEKDAASFQETFAIISKMLPLYFRQWGGDFRAKQWVSLEEEFNVPYTTFDGTVTFPLRGKIDGVYRAGDNIWIMDTKTKSVINDPTLSTRLGYDLQMGFYMYAVSVLYGKEPTGLLYNLIRRPQLRRKVSESVDDFASRCAADAWNNMSEYFRRIEVIVLPEERDRFRRELFASIDAFVTWYRNGFPHYRNSANCYNGMWKCEFIDACGAGMFENLRVKGRPYMELSPAGHEQK